MGTYFQDGQKITDGQRFDAIRTEDFTSSNGVTIYTATLWEDHTTSCNCPGWAIRKTCKHTKTFIRPGRPVHTRSVTPTPPPRPRPRRHSIPPSPPVRIRRIELS